MKVTFCGAARDVTGSQFLFSIDGKQLLVDCGMYQGRRSEAYERNENFQFDPSTVDAVLLTHAHMDHAGNLPTLVRKGFKGKIHATAPTAELSKILLKDSAYLQEREIHWVNKIRERQGEPPAHALYSVAEAEACMDSFVARDYDKAFQPIPGVTVTFRDAGHILGSSSIQLDINERGRQFRVGIGVDLGRPHMPLENDPNVLRDSDILLMECTYGNRFHTPIDTVDEDLARIIREVSEGGGKIIIPSFAVGRTQTLIYLLHKLFNQNRIPEIPIYVDSPMALEATQIYRNHLENLDRETFRTFVRNHEDPFGFSRLHYVKDVIESKKLNALTYPHIIIASSGMCEGGRVLHHLANNIGNHKALVLFVGYAAQHTLARRIVDGAEEVKIFGEKHRVKCQVKVMDAFSAHADRRDLLDYVKLTPPSKLKRIFLVHGEQEQALPLRDALRSQGYDQIDYPSRGESFEL